VPVRFNHVLCATDFSEGSRRALDYAVVLARWYHARLSVVHVHQLSTPTYAVSSVGPEGLQPIVLTELERRSLLERLQAEVAEDRAAAHVAVEIALDEGANVAEAIVSRARITSADVIVIGTHGRSGFERLMLGSVAEQVLRKAACPVLTVPAHSPDVVPLVARSIRRILCPVDFSTSSRDALAYAASLAEETHARLTVLHVLELPPDLSEFAGAMGLLAYRDARFYEAKTQLLEVIASAVPATCMVNELVLVGKPSSEILRVAAEREVDLIAIGVCGRGPVDLMFFGSTTNHVVRGAHCPVLTLKGEHPR
jgi:nucleotide-binding universal stress UspA family protein